MNCQAPLSVGSSRQEYWSGLPFPPLGGLPDPGMEPTSPASPALAGGLFAYWTIRDRREVVSGKLGYLYPRPHPQPLLLYLPNTLITLHHSSIFKKHKFVSTWSACKQSRPYHHHLTREQTEAHGNKVVYQIAQLVRSEVQRPWSGTFHVFWQLGDTMK